MYTYFAFFGTDRCTPDNSRSGMMAVLLVALAVGVFTFGMSRRRQATSHKKLISFLTFASTFGLLIGAAFAYLGSLCS